MVVTFEAPMFLTGDEPARCCVMCGGPAAVFDVAAGPWCSDACRDGKVRVPLKRCCLAVLEGEYCDCAEFLAGW